MPDVGHEANGGGRSKTAYAGLVLNFVIAVLLAFIGFTLNQLHQDTQISLAIAQQNQVAIGSLDSKLDAITGRLDRLERTQDRQTE